jgi:transposase InsO family protein
MLSEVDGAGERRTVQRFERASPNELWQMDFKGHFAMVGGGRCHPLTVLDDHSRYSIGLRACENQQATTVMRELVTMFQQYGLPVQMLMDNGSPWGDSGGQPWTIVTSWLIRLGIRVTHIRPHHPQTQGKDERFHRTLKAEVLRDRSHLDLPACQSDFDPWRDIYNRERPHEALA